MPPYQPLDFYRLDELLTDEQKNVRQSVRAWVDERFMPLIQDCFEEGRFPMDLAGEMADLGLFGINLPEEYGGAGMDNVTYGLVCQELERGDSGLRSFASVQTSLAMYAIYAHAQESLKKKYLPLMARGELIGCFGLTEPNHGSDPGSMETTARAQGDHYVLNGQKMWITNGSVAQVAVVWAKLDGEIRGFLVDCDTVGFSAPEQKHKFSLRASITSELVLEDVKVPKSHLFPRNPGLKGPLMCLTQARSGIAMGVLGSAMDCFVRAVDYTTTRHQFGRPLANNQLVQAELADMATELTKGQLLGLRLMQMKDQGTMRHPHVSMAKRNNCTIALDIARRARDLLGANGISYEYHVCRHLANLETVRTYEGTHNIHTLTLGREITGLDAFR